MASQEYSYLSSEDFLSYYYSISGVDDMEDSISRVQIQQIVDLKLRGLLRKDNYADFMSILDVKDNYVMLPDGLKFINQVAAIPNITGGGVQKPKFIRKIRELTSKVSEDCDVEISVVCHRCGRKECSCDQNSVLVDLDRIKRAENYHYFMELYYKQFTGYIGGWRKQNTDIAPRSLLCPEFVLLKYKGNKFGHQEYHISDCLNLKLECEHTYDIQADHRGRKMITSFKEGMVLLSYVGVKVDPSGFSFIPDLEQVISYLVEVVDYHLYRKKFLNGEPNASQKMSFLKQTMEEAKVRADAVLSTRSYAEWNRMIEQIFLRRASHIKRSDRLTVEDYMDRYHRHFDEDFYKELNYGKNTYQ